MQRGWSLSHGCPGHLQAQWSCLETAVPPWDCEPVWVGSWASLSPGWGVGGAGARGLFLLVQVGVWIDVGSRYESERNNGAGYFVEHLAFKVSPAPARGLALSLPGSRLPVSLLERASCEHLSGEPCTGPRVKDPQEPPGPTLHQRGRAWLCGSRCAVAMGAWCSAPPCGLPGHLGFSRRGWDSPHCSPQPGQVGAEEGLTLLNEWKWGGGDVDGQPHQLQAQTWGALSC